MFAQRLTAVLALMLALGGGVPWTADAQSGSPTLPAEQQAQGISYLTGGVNLDESTALKSVMKHYPLVVEVFDNSEGTNAYTSDAQLTLADRKGEQVFSATLAGPFALVKAPPGRYTAKVTYAGQTKQQAVTVKQGGHARATFVFKAG